MKFEGEYRIIKKVPFDDGSVGIIIELDNSIELDNFIDESNKSDKTKKIKLEVSGKRSLSANAYLWVLLDKMAKVIQNTTKEQVYKELVRANGVFDVVTVAKPAVHKLVQMWEEKGLGWQAEILSYSDVCDVALYYGSSSYSGAEMCKLLDEVVYEAKELGIETLPPDELERIKSLA